MLRQAPTANRAGRGIDEASGVASATGRSGPMIGGTGNSADCPQSFEHCLPDIQRLPGGVLLCPRRWQQEQLFPDRQQLCPHDSCVCKDTSSCTSGANSANARHTTNAARAPPMRARLTAAVTDLSKTRFKYDAFQAVQHPGPNIYYRWLRLCEGGRRRALSENVVFQSRVRSGVSGSQAGGNFRRRCQRARTGPHHAVRGLAAKRRFAARVAAGFACKNWTM